MLVARPTLLRAASLSLCLLAPALARAGNGTHPRTPVKWDPDTACMTIVDRTVEPKLTFNYAIPYPDLRPEGVTDEVDDSRRHQFIALCQDHSPQEPMPEWLSMADVEATAAAGIVDVEDVKPENVMESNAEWMDCFVRITADDERRLITEEEAAKPVVWDTTGVPIGAYVVSGYTWEPVFNIWTDRPGLVKVVDDPDPAKNPPALAISNRDEIKYSDETLTLVGCVSAMDGSTITGSWAITGDDTPDVLEWTDFGANTPVSGDTFELDFTPPPEVAGQSVAIKIEIVDPMDRKYVAHLSDLASILIDPKPEDCMDGGMGFISMPGCESSSSGGESSDSATGEPNTTSASDPGTGTSAGSSGATDDTGAPQDPKDGGCGGCALGDTGMPALLFAPWLLWTARRRRRA